MMIEETLIQYGALGATLIWFMWFTVFTQKKSREEGEQTRKVIENNTLALNTFCNAYIPKK